MVHQYVGNMGRYVITLTVRSTYVMIVVNNVVNNTVMQNIVQNMQTSTKTSPPNSMNVWPLIPNHDMTDYIYCNESVVDSLADNVHSRVLERKI